MISSSEDLTEAQKKYLISLGRDPETFGKDIQNSFIPNTDRGFADVIGDYLKGKEPDAKEESAGLFDSIMNGKALQQHGLLSLLTGKGGIPSLGIPGQEPGMQNNGLLAKLIGGYGTSSGGGLFGSGGIGGWFS